MEIFFLSSLVKLFHDWYCNRNLAKEHFNLPSPTELESAYQCVETLGPKETFFDELPFHMDAELRGPKTVFLVNSNMKRFHEGVTKLLDQESLYIYCDLKVHAPESKILHFLNQCKISPNSIVVMNVWDNSLLQGRTAPTADEVGGPSGKPSDHLKDTQTRGRAHHQVEVAPYNKKFGEHLAAKMCWMTAHGHCVILISPLLRYPVHCCWIPNHFPHNFNYNLFMGEIFKLGVFMSQIQHCPDP